jgi:hypothetical protein
MGRPVASSMAPALAQVDKANESFRWARQGGTGLLHSAGPRLIFGGFEETMCLTAAVVIESAFVIVNESPQRSL